MTENYVSATNLSGTAGDVSTMFFGTVSGGLSAKLTGGNFWQGAATGLTVSALNHVNLMLIYGQDIDHLQKWLPLS